MSHPQIGLAPRLPISPAPAATARAGVAAAIAMVAVAGLASLATARQLDAFLTDVARKALEQAEHAFASAGEQQRGYLRAQVAVLADDTRIRATVVAPKFDENTVRDVLEDLKKASGATVLAVLDAGGKVKAVAGLERLRGADVSSSPVIRAALEGPAVDSWTFAEQLLIVGVAPVRSGDHVPALLMMGFAVSERLLAEIHRTSGVLGAAFVGDKAVLAGAKDPAAAEALRLAASVPEGADAVVGPRGELLARTKRTSNAATAARMAWIVPRHEGSDRVPVLRAMAWTPVVTVLLTIALMFLFVRRRSPGERQ